MQRAAAHSGVVFGRQWWFLFLKPPLPPSSLGVITLRLTTSSAYKDAFLDGSSSNYVAEMYEAWQKDPESVHKSWDAYFRGVPVQSPSTLGAPPNSIPVSALQQTMVSSVPSVTGAPVSIDEKAIADHLAVQGIIRSFQIRGHQVARIDPMGLTKTFFHHDEYSHEYALADMSQRDFIIGSSQTVGATDWKPHESDMERVFRLPGTTFIGGREKALPLGEILNRLERAYCGSYGLEFMYINNLDQLNWIRRKFETPGISELSNDQKRLCLARLIRASGFEAFLAKKYSSEKRFGLEGCEILIPAMKQIIDVSSNLGVESFVMGMPHRGRLNVLANVCRKPLEQMFGQFFTLTAADEGSGDVKYHLGTYTERLNRTNNKTIRLSVVANPSHLEAVDPVVQGRTRAEQFYRGDNDGSKQTGTAVGPATGPAAGGTVSWQAQWAAHREFPL
ncbi:unnamed protein product [Cyprideis torosa]|uniref:2-oxoglutarate dehydrogenase, mitochondrial n=1 Tax=Cyprideis torosa TaxID=163714 RepID=A0A7R8ZV68_9CRUS|nr:unnamed protein product [Cyprideis torosa]CAG0902452.1 unnamed protein product [Cyprideis torosa]